MRCLEQLRQIVDVRDDDPALHLRRGARRSVTRAIDAEQPVAADRKREQIAVRRPAARHQRPVASTRSNDSTSAMIGRRRRPRP